MISFFFFLLKFCTKTLVLFNFMKVTQDPFSFRMHSASKKIFIHLKHSISSAKRPIISDHKRTVIESIKTKQTVADESRSIL